MCHEIYKHTKLFLLRRGIAGWSGAYPLSPSQTSYYYYYYSPIRENVNYNLAREGTIGARPAASSGEQALSPNTNNNNSNSSNSN